MQRSQEVERPSCRAIYFVLGFINVSYVCPHHFCNTPSYHNFLGQIREQSQQDLIYRHGQDGIPS